MKYTKFLLYALVAISFVEGASKNETWTSSVGSKIDGFYIGTTGLRHWIVCSTGRLFKLKESELSKESIERIYKIKKQELRDSEYIKRSSLIPLESTHENEVLITTLCSVKVPRISFNGVPVSSALKSLNEIAGTDISFKLEAGVEDQKSDFSVRNLYMIRILDILTQQARSYYRVEDGEIVIRKE